MHRARRFVLAAAIAAAAVLPPATARAELCLSDADCPTSPLGGGRSCTRQTILGIGLFWGNCARRDACNTGRDCIPSAECRDGACRRPAGTCATEGDCADDERCASGRCEPTAPAGSGTGTSGAGKRCMPADGSKPSGWAQDKHGKPLGGCPTGTACGPHGYCVNAT